MGWVRSVNVFRGREHQESLSLGSSPSWNRFNRRTVLLTWQKLFGLAFSFGEQDRASAFARKWIAMPRKWEAGDTREFESQFSHWLAQWSLYYTVLLREVRRRWRWLTTVLMGLPQGRLSGIPGSGPTFGYSSVHLTLSPLFPCLSSEAIGLKALRVPFN